MSGRVSVDGKGVAGATVYAEQAEGLMMGRGELASLGVTGPKGLFTLELAEGRYLLFAATDDKFGFFGRNPVRVFTDHGGVNIPLVDAHPQRIKPARTGSETIGGTLLLDGAPVADGYVGVYLSPRKGFREAPYAVSARTDTDGRFEIPVEPGSYFLVGRKRESGRISGPLKPGDFFGVHPSVPIKLLTASSVTADFEMVQLPEREDKPRLPGPGVAVLKGIVTDRNGKPLEGFTPGLYRNARLANEPEVLGEPTGPDGRFRLETTLAGSFFVGARERLGGPPVSGERVGFLRDTPSGRVSISPEKKVTGLRLVVEETP